MWGFGNKGEYAPEPKYSNYKEGQVVYQPGDYPSLPKIVYKCLNDGTILVAEFLVTEDNILFVKNVMLEDWQIAKTTVNKDYSEYLNMVWQHHLKTGEFIKNRQKHEAAIAAATGKRYNVHCSMNSKEVFTWYDLSEEQANKLYGDLKAAQVRKINWETDASFKDRQFIVGEQITSVSTRSRNSV